MIPVKRPATLCPGRRKRQFTTPRCPPRSLTTPVRGLRRKPGYWVLLAVGCSGSITTPYGDGDGSVEAESSPSPELGLPADAVEILELLADLEDDVAAESIVASVSHGSYRDGFPWIKVNELPFRSAVADGTIDVWFSGPGATAYAAISPEASAAGVQVPIGTMIVREVQNAQGEVTALTLMLKAEAGYNPELARGLLVRGDSAQWDA